MCAHTGAPAATSGVTAQRQRRPLFAQRMVNGARFRPHARVPDLLLNRPFLLPALSGFH